MKELIIMYLPIIITAISTVLNFTKVSSMLKNVFKGDEIKQLKKELENINSRLNEQIRVNKELTNAVGKVKIYEDNEIKKL